MTILPTTYWGNIEYFARLVEAGEEHRIDLGEHYIKRSERNRTTIMTANGVMALSVPLCHANRPRTPITAMQIDNSTRWQHRHWTAITSAYRSSAYFDVIADRIEPLYEQRFESLVELNEATLRASIELARLGVEPHYSHDYITATEQVLDLRPKHRESTIAPQPYFQLFCDRYPFTPNLSILDLMMSDLISTRDYLTRVVK